MPTLRAFLLITLHIIACQWYALKRNNVKVKILLCATVSLLLLCGIAQYFPKSTSTPDIVLDITTIPQGAYEQIILEHEGITDEEICRIYASNVSYWNEVDKIMCGDWQPHTITLQGCAKMVGKSGSIPGHPHYKFNFYLLLCVVMTPFPPPT